MYLLWEPLGAECCGLDGKFEYQPLDQIFLASGLVNRVDRSVFFFRIIPCPGPKNRLDARRGYVLSVGAEHGEIHCGTEVSTEIEQVDFCQFSNFAEDLPGAGLC